MGSAWYALYGFAAYRGAVAQLLRAAQAWQQQLEQRSQGEAAAFDRVELLAWRTLGEALLLIDLYEQDGSRRSAAIGGATSAAQRVPVWWRALHKWLWR